MNSVRAFALVFLVLGLASSSKTIQAHPWGGLVVDTSGRIFFTFVCPILGDHHVACIWRLDPGDDDPRQAFSAQTSPSDLILARSPSRHLFGAQRDLQSGQYQTSLWKLAPPDSHETVIEPTTNPLLFNPQAYTVDDRGNTFFSHETKVYQRNPAGDVSILAGEFEQISTMSWGPDSLLYVVDGYDLRRVAANGEVTTITVGVKENSPEHLPFAGANIIFDMAVDNLHNVYLAYYGNRCVLKVSPDGTITTLLQAEGNWSPHGIDLYEGEVYVLESTVGVPAWWQFWKPIEIRPRIRKVNQSGKVETLYEYIVDR